MNVARIYSGKGGVGKTTTTANVAIVSSARMLYNAYRWPLSSSKGNS